MENKDNHPNLSHLWGDNVPQQPSTDTRPPQLNSTICGCNCAQRGFVDGRTRQEGHGTSYAAIEAYLGGQEGVESHMLADIQIQAPIGSHVEPYMDVIQHAEYADRHVVPQIGLMDNGSGFEDCHLQGVGSDDSMHAQGESSGIRSVASSGFLSLRAESPSPMMHGIGAWTNPILNARSDYYFITAPLALVAPVRCCCHTETDTEFDDNSSADYSYTSISDTSGDVRGDDSEN